MNSMVIVSGISDIYIYTYIYIYIIYINYTRYTASPNLGLNCFYGDF